MATSNNHFVQASQRQIARVARSPASQRTELDALIDPDRRRQIDSQRNLLSETLTQLQSTRQRLTRQGARIPAVATEVRTVQDQIDFRQSEGRKDVLGRFESFERQRAWIDDRRKLGEVLGSGRIDQPEIKDLVSIIMEGGAEAFRLRRKRYGY